MKLILAIAVGGAPGAVARYKAGYWLAQVLGHGFPWGTLAVNIIGSFLMGLLVEGAAVRWHLDGNLKALLMTGLLGGFTTFSTFSLDVVTLLQRDQILLAGVYLLGSVIVSILALFLGILLIRWGLS
jgi:CrcB protein